MMKKIQFTLGVLLFGLGALIACWLVYWSWLVWRVGGPSTEKLNVFIFQFGVEAALVAAFIGGALALFALANARTPAVIKFDAKQFCDPLPKATRAKLDWRHVERILIVAEPPSVGLLPLMDFCPSAAVVILDGAFSDEADDAIFARAMDAFCALPGNTYEHSGLVKNAIAEAKGLYAGAAS